MVKSKVLGIGSYVPDRIVKNEEIAFLNERHERQPTQQLDTSDDWIQQRTGIRERRYVPADGSVSCSDLGLRAAIAALEDAQVAKEDIDCIIFATLSPDIHFPGSGVFLQAKLGISGKACACYDVRQQCSGFLYGMQMADAFIKTGLYKRILLVGAELHSHSLDYSTRGRDVAVLFGDGAGAFVIGPAPESAVKTGILYTDVHADGTGANDLYLKIFEIAHAPYVWYDARDYEQNIVKYPQMDGKKVYVNAVRHMVESTVRALTVTKLDWNQVDWFVPHQANLRINQKVAEVGHIPAEKVLNTIELYGNTTAASVPLTIDHWRKAGKVKRGDLIVSSVFGSGYTWGAAAFYV
jgi:3-oxoacyl-[acyl-carrier-protein] synthase-3